MDDTAICCLGFIRGNTTAKVFSVVSEDDFIDPLKALNILLSEPLNSLGRTVGQTHLLSFFLILFGIFERHSVSWTIWWQYQSVIWFDRFCE